MLMPYARGEEERAMTDIYAIYARICTFVSSGFWRYAFPRMKAVDAGHDRVKSRACSG